MSSELTRDPSFERVPPEPEFTFIRYLSPWTDGDRQVSVLSSNAAGGMMEYHVYQLDPRGHILDRVDFFCDADGPAIQGAHSAFPQSDVELWQGSRRIGTFAKDPSAETQSFCSGFPNSPSDWGNC